MSKIAAPAMVLQLIGFDRAHREGTAVAEVEDRDIKTFQTRRIGAMREHCCMATSAATSSQHSFIHKDLLHVSCTHPIGSSAYRRSRYRRV